MKMPRDKAGREKLRKQLDDALLVLENMGVNTWALVHWWSYKSLKEDGFNRVKDDLKDAGHSLAAGNDQLREEALQGIADAYKRTPADEVDAQRDGDLDEARDYCFYEYESIAGMGKALDPDYRKPMLKREKSAKAKG